MHLQGCVKLQSSLCGVCLPSLFDFVGNLLERCIPLRRMRLALNRVVVSRKRETLSGDFYREFQLPKSNLKSFGCISRLHSMTDFSIATAGGSFAISFRLCGESIKTPYSSEMHAARNEPGPGQLKEKALSGDCYREFQLPKSNSEAFAYISRLHSMEDFYAYGISKRINDSVSPISIYLYQIAIPLISPIPSKPGKSTKPRSINSHSSLDAALESSSNGFEPEQRPDPCGAQNANWERMPGYRSLLTTASHLNRVSASLQVEDPITVRSEFRIGETVLLYRQCFST
ncbi:hypothetical protein CDAR_28231 [Caerostris darwini]|uniref:Uncharacterized protein n=1 Tax=Caerostris darwini TaxID=1538125 RepID=A0AAV4NVW9_9ARAC|nr:hypothetical protein CDAR_28231 [Caerostris darwini]